MAGVEFDDLFTEASADTALASHTPTDAGTGWTEELNDGTSTWEATTTNGTAKVDADDSAKSIIMSAQVSGGLSSADYDVVADITVEDGANGEDSIGMIARLEDADNFYYLRVRTKNGNDLFIREVVGGSAQNLSAIDTDVNWTNNDLKFELRGTALKAFTGATEQSSVTATDLTAAGEAGMAIGRAATVASGSVATIWEITRFTVTTAAVAGGGPIHLVMAPYTST